MSNPYKFGDKLISYSVEIDPVEGEYFTIEFIGKCVDVIGDIVIIYGQTNFNLLKKLPGPSGFHFKQCELVGEG